jgi:hypothetical protein
VRGASNGCQIGVCFDDFPKKGSSCSRQISREANEFRSTNGLKPSIHVRTPRHSVARSGRWTQLLN